jgi:dTDP-4-amino-4,6-dideoxygalactose transaminase
MNKKDYEMEGDIRTWGVYVPDEAIEAIQGILKSKWLNTGEQEVLFRRKVCEKFNFPYCVATNNGTAALRASLAMLGVGPGDEVITTPYTFIATNTSILEQGAQPVFADIKYDDLNIDPESIAEKITKKTKAIICVHYAGNPCDMNEIKEIGRINNLPIIEDCAHALGSQYKGRFVGVLGDVGCFSFQVVKIITCGDGGAIVTSNEENYKKLKKYIWYGVDRETKMTRLIDPLPDDIDILGFKYNMNDIVASLGIAGLNHFEIPMKRRKEIGEKYRLELSDCSKVKLMNYTPDKTPNYQIFPVHVANRVEFAKHMQNYSIQVNVNNRRNDRYSVFGGKRELPVTEKADNDVILLPMHADLTDYQVEMIIETMKEYDRM